jgi:predicted transcriptional regulator
MRAKPLSETLAIAEAVRGAEARGWRLNAISAGLRTCKASRLRAHAD